MTERMIEPELLQSFIAIADHGSFTEAAAHVHRTQSAVSMQMRRLEQVLGRRLFGKAGRGMALTSDGELFLAHARRLLQAQREVLQAFDASALDGRVRIGAPDDYAVCFLPPVLARFARSHPKVEVEMVVEGSGQLAAMVARDELDLAMVTQGSGEVEATILRREPLVWVGAPGQHLQDCDPLPLALFHPGCSFRKAALAGLAAIGRPSRVAYTSMSFAGVCAAVTAGLAVAVLARSTVPAGLRILGEGPGLPPLPQVGLVLVRRARPGSVVDVMEREIMGIFGRPTPSAQAA
jgi:DNA-binding transcriptional LysR family regulator